MDMHGSPQVSPSAQPDPEGIYFRGMQSIPPVSKRRKAMGRAKKEN